MTSDARTSICVALEDPRAVRAWSLGGWDQVVRYARRTDLLSRLAIAIDESGMLSDVPPAPRAHLEAARLLARAQENAVRREIAFIHRALAPLGTTVVLLKGAAYLIARLPAAKGRVFSDIDILVPKSALRAVEAALMMHGWATTHLHPYDQRYYRRWMHELPPMRHVARLTVIDVHHAILPSSARTTPDSAPLLAASTCVDGHPEARVLAPVDMVLHSAAHLFYNEEFSHGLRDLFDLHDLLMHFSRDPGFWNDLAARATELGLRRPLYYALRYTHRILATPVPSEVIDGVSAAAPLLVRRLMDSLFVRALWPDDAPGGMGRIAGHALYVRAHWLKMPPHLLAWHLTMKMIRREPDDAVEQAAA